MIGVWSPEDFAAYRAAPDGPRKRFLANRLYVDNEPLVKTLVAQLLGQGERRLAHRIPAKLRRENRSENVESWEDAMGAAGVAFGKALRDYDPERGKISYHLAFKIKYELQCLIEHSQNVRVKRELSNLEAPRGFVRDDQDGEGIGFEELVHRQRVDSGESAEAIDEGELPAEPEGPAKLPSGALAAFLDSECVFRARARMARAPLFGAYRRLALRLGFPVLEGRLRAALRVRHVASVVGRFRPHGEPERGFIGISLRSMVEKQAA